MQKVIVTTSWDDGHKFDLKIAKLLKKYGLKGTFYISPKSWELQPEDRLSDKEIRFLSDDFEIGAHTMTHPRLDLIDIEEARKEILDSKNFLEKIIEKPVVSFCYPYGGFNNNVKKIIKESGFIFARSIERFAVNNIDRLAAKTSVDTFDHLRDGIFSALRLCGNKPWKIFKLWRWDNLAREMFLKAQKENGVFHLWGHSRDIDKHNDWERLEKLLAFIASHKNILCANNADIPIKKPKLLVATPYFGQNLGGLEKYVFQITSGLKKEHNWDIVIVTSGDINKKTAKTKICQKIKVYRLPYSFKLSNTPVGIFWYSKLKQIIAFEKPDIINAHMPVPFMADIITLIAGKIPLVLTYHMGSMKKNKLVIDILIRFYENVLLKITLKKAQSIICSSCFVQFNFLKDYFYKTFTITPGVDINLFHPIKKPNKYNLMHVGGLRKSEEHKGLAESLKAVVTLKKKYPEIHLHIAGEGDKVDYYKNLSEKMGIKNNVTFYGRLSSSKIIELYQKTDIFLAPIKKESFGIAIAEAMACGLPVIANKAEGIPYLIEDHNNGFIINLNQKNQIAEKVDFIFQHPEVAQQIGVSARNSIKLKYQWKDKVAETNNYLLKILGLAEKKPKLLITAPYYFPKIGGLENYARQIALELKKRDWDIVVISSNHRDDNFNIEIIDGIRIYRLPAGFRFSNTPFGLKWFFSILHIIKNEKPNIINAHTPVPGMSDITALLKSKIPFILTYHAATIYKNDNLFFNVLIFFYRLIERNTFNLSEAVIAVSPYHKDYISPAIKNKIILIENGISSEEIIKKIPEKNGDYIIFIGNLEKAHAWKGLEKILEAVCLYKQTYRKNIHLDVVGDGNYADYYKNMVKKLELTEEVLFHGSKTGQEKNIILERASALICYPVSAQDAFPTVILEAWAHYTPVIAADIGAISHIIQDKKDGILVEPNNPLFLAENIFNLLQNKNLLESLAQKGREKARFYTWDRQGEKTDKLFKKFL